MEDAPLVNTPLMTQEADHDLPQPSCCLDDEADDDDDDVKLVAFDNFTDGMIDLVRGHNFSRCTHLDLSGIKVLNTYNFLELMNELIDYQYCENMLAIHLNDLGLNFNQ